MFSDFDVSDWTANIIVSHVTGQCASVVKMQQQLPSSEFIDDDKFRAIVVGMLDMKQWAKEKLHGYLQDDNQMWYFERALSLKESHRNRLSVLRQQIADPGATSESVSFASLKLLRSKGLVARDYHPKQIDGAEALIVTAVEDGWCVENIQALIAIGGNLSTTHSSGESLLSIAAKYGHIRIMEFLLLQGSNPNSANETEGQFQGCTALHWASFSGHSDCVRQIRHGSHACRCHEQQTCLYSSIGHCWCISQCPRQQKQYASPCRSRCGAC